MQAQPRSPYSLLEAGGDAPKIPALSPARVPAECTRRPLTLTRALRDSGHRKRACIALLVAQELAAQHAEGVVVGELNPRTISFSLTGCPELRRGSVVSTETAYAAPEVVGNPATSRRAQRTSQTDVYALGALLYFLFTARTPPAVWSAGDFARLSPALAICVAHCVAADGATRPLAEEVARFMEAAGPERLVGHHGSQRST